METTEIRKNPLGEEPVNKLLRQFAVPSVIALLVSNLYNIVDQFFIGQAVGELGNAATNVAFPMTMCCIATALMFGIGGAAAFNLSMGRKETEAAAHYAAVSISTMLLFGAVLCIVCQLFLEPLLTLFGAPEDVMPYAKIYTRVTSLGFPFLILSSGGGHIVRADGSPRFIMYCNLLGALINTALDWLFVFKFSWDMGGAGFATIIGQIIAGLLVINYLRRYKTVKLLPKYFIPRFKYVKRVASLGMGPCTNQLAMMVVQIVLNNSLSYYGAHSVYGQAIPLACAGIIMKVNMLYFSFPIGISQGLQPIASFNYGAQQYPRVKSAYLTSVLYASAVGVVAFVLFQCFPREIIGFFGQGSPEYFEFAEKFFRGFLLLTALNAVQPLTSNLFTAIGKPAIGIFVSLTRQIIFFLPLILLLPRFFGIDGVIYSGPLADSIALATAIFVVYRELRRKEYQGQ